MSGRQVVSTRPVFAFEIGTDWQACVGADPIAPPRLTQAEALRDLPAEAGLELNGASQQSPLLAVHATYSAIEPYRVRPVSNGLPRLKPRQGQRGHGLPWGRR